MKAEGIGALAFVPLVAKGELIGKFMTYYDAPHVFGAPRSTLPLPSLDSLASALRGCARRKLCARARPTLRSELDATQQLQNISTQLIHENNSRDAV